MKRSILLYNLFFLTIFFSIQSNTKEVIYQQNTQISIAHNIAVIGTGYVGLVTGPCLAEFGNFVTCADINVAKIQKLKIGEIPIYEPGLEAVIKRNVHTNHLFFTHDVSGAIKNADVIFIAVGTPMGNDGAADLRAVKSVVKMIAENLNGFKVIATKSTVPIGTGKWIKETLINQYGIDSELFAVVSNPEFLREGSAIKDFLHPDRLVIGTDCQKARTIMRQVYHRLSIRNIPHVFTDVVTAESIKYASNAFLATKISYINEIATLCDATGADVKTIAYALGLDYRISKHFLRPGPGFGGSCFPKDSQALLYTAKKYGVSINTVKAALDTNKKQKKQPVKKLLKLMNNRVANKTIAILGLAFKAKTDDVRYSPAIPTIKKLLKYGAQIKTYDPQAMKNMRHYFPDITYCSSLDDAVRDTDAIIIMTEWDDFKYMDLDYISTLVKKRIIVDARNILDTDMLRALNFSFDTIGHTHKECD